jgi:hypothetical protein
MTAGNGLNLMWVTYKVQDTGPPEPLPSYSQTGQENMRKVGEKYPLGLNF